MDFIITGKPSEEALSQLIESLLVHIIQNKLHEKELSAQGRAVRSGREIGTGDL